MSFARRRRASAGAEDPGVVRQVAGARARRGISLAFMLHAILGATWGARLPALKAHAGLTDGQLGLTLFALAAGMIVGTRLAGSPIDRYGSGPLTRYGMPVMCAVLVAPALAEGPVTLAAAFLVVGSVAGLLDVAINAQGVTVEGSLDRPILSGLHGLWAVGLGIGAGIGALFAAVGASPIVHFTVVGGLLAALSVPALRGSAPSAVARSAASVGAGEFRRPVVGGGAGPRRDRLLLVLRRGKHGRLERRVSPRLTRRRRGRGGVRLRRLLGRDGREPVRG